MKGFLLPSIALALLAGACSSTQTAQNAQPVPAQAAGTFVTEWGTLPAYMASDKGNPLVINPQQLPAPRADNYFAEFDLLVERDGTVRDVVVRNPSRFPTLDQTAVATFKESRSRLLLASSDPAPYIIRYTLVRKTERGDANPSYAAIPRYPAPDQRMGSGEPYWGKP